MTSLSNNEQATSEEISRLLYNAYIIAMVYCDLRTAIYKVNPQKIYTGEKIRALMPYLFENKRLPESLKEHLRVYWILPTAFRMLRLAGYEHEYTIKLFTNISSAEAVYLTRTFSAMSSEAAEFWNWRKDHMKAG
jgi:hypothetical protein